MAQKNYTMGDGRSADLLDATVVPRGTVLTATTTFVKELGDRGTARLDLVTTAVSGTSPTLDVAISTSPDGVTYTAVASFAQVTAAGSLHKVFSGLDRFVRAVCTLGGSAGPSVTFGLDGEAC